VNHFQGVLLYGRLPGLPANIRLERPARDKRSSLLRTLVKYIRKKLYNIGSRSISSSEMTLTEAGDRVVGSDVTATASSYQPGDCQLLFCGSWVQTLDPKKTSECFLPT
jgi:hypothetical protein